MIIKPRPIDIKRWIAMVADHGCIVTGDSQTHLHHCKGRMFKHNKIQVGEIFILPLAIPLHDVHSNHPFNVTHRKKNFEREYGTEKELFDRLCADFDYKLPFDEVFYDAVMDI